VEAKRSLVGFYIATGVVVLLLLVALFAYRPLKLRSAPSPASLQEPSSQAAAAVETKRSRRVCIYWGIALTLLVTVGLLCWLVVVPVMEVDEALQGCDLPTLKGLHPPPQEVERLRTQYQQAIKELGGPEQAERKLGLYMRLPDWALGRGKAEVGVRRQKVQTLLGWARYLRRRETAKPPVEVVPITQEVEE
jgi:hypothetical protein